MSIDHQLHRLFSMWGKKTGPRMYPVDNLQTGLASGSLRSETRSRLRSEMFTTQITSPAKPVTFSSIGAARISLWVSTQLQHGLVAEWLMDIDGRAEAIPILVKNPGNRVSSLQKKWSNRFISWWNNDSMKGKKIRQKPWLFRQIGQGVVPAPLLHLLQHLHPVQAPILLHGMDLNWKWFQSLDWF